MPRDETCKNMVAHMSCGAVPRRRAGPAGRAAPTMHSILLFSLNPAGLSGIFFPFSLSCLMGPHFGILVHLSERESDLCQILLHGIPN